MVSFRRPAGGAALAALALLAALGALALARAGRGASGWRADGGNVEPVAPAAPAPAVARAPEPEAEPARAALAAPAEASAPAPPPPRERSFAARGVASGVDGLPVAGVALACSADGRDPRPRAVTGADGSFEIELPRGITDVVSADPAWVVLAGGEWSVGDERPLALVLSPAGRVTGFVVDAETDAPLAGARIAVVPPPCAAPSSAWRDLATTDREGAFSFALAPTAPGTRVEAAYAGYAPAGIELGAAPGAPFVLRLEPALPVRVAGTVRIAGGAPAGGARVTLGHEGATADAEGRFELELATLEPGAALSATLEPYAPARIERFGDRLLAGGSGAGIALDLGLETAAIEGVVVDARGAPQKRWTVEARLGGPAGPVAGASRATRGDGAFRIEGLAPGVYALCAFGRGRAAALAPGVSAPGSSARVVVGDAVRVTGRVLDPSGAPAAGASVALWRPFDQDPAVRTQADALTAATAGADGGFALEGPLPAVLEAGLSGAYAAELPLEPGAATADLVLRLERRRTFRFEARDAERPPSALVAVDAGGAVVPLTSPSGVRRSVPLLAGRSAQLHAPEAARLLVLLRGGRELARVPLAPDDEGFVRW